MGFTRHELVLASLNLTTLENVFEVTAVASTCALTVTQAHYRLRANGTHLWVLSLSHFVGIHPTTGTGGGSTEGIALRLLCVFRSSRVIRYLPVVPWYCNTEVAQ